MRKVKHFIDVPNVEKVGVYAIFNKRTNKYYVGSSVNIKRRMKQHRSKIEKLKGSNIKMENDLKSQENIYDFSFIVLETFEDFSISESYLKEKELYYIKKLNAWNGYNESCRKPYKSGYYTDDELLFCQKEDMTRQRDIKTMTNKTLLNLYKRKLLKKETAPNVFLFSVEGEILERMN